jgi:LmbE family N-acetylglucosaminyl deacetylase
MMELSLSTPDKRPPRILCLGAHADDIEIGCGGTMRLLMDAHPEAAVHWVVFGATGEREDEARRSAAWYLDGVAEATVQVEAFPNSYYPDHWATIKEVFEKDLKPFAPDLIFTHYREDRHQDHRVIAELTWNTFRDHLVLEYEIPKYDGDLGQPNMYVPLADDAVAAKVNGLLEVFSTQRSRQWFDEETFLGFMRLRGVECAAHYAEAFHAHKVTWRGR